MLYFFLYTLMYILNLFCQIILQMDYLDWLSDQLGITRPPQKLKDFYARFIERYLHDHEGFRETFEKDLLDNDEL